MSAPRFELRDKEDTFFGNYYNELWMIDGGTETLIATDGGEPEDQTFTRDWSWVVPLLEKMYENGYEDGRDVGYLEGYEYGVEDGYAAGKESVDGTED